MACRKQRANPRQNPAEDAEDDEDIDVSQFALDDARRTAGLILRLLKRDMAALLTVYEWDEEFESPALHQLARAQRLTRGLKKLFPDTEGP